MANRFLFNYCAYVTEWIYWYTYRYVFPCSLLVLRKKICYLATCWSRPRHIVVVLSERCCVCSQGYYQTIFTKPCSLAKHLSVALSYVNLCFCFSTKNIWPFADHLQPWMKMEIAKRLCCVLFSLGLRMDYHKRKVDTNCREFCSDRFGTNIKVIGQNFRWFSLFSYHRGMVFARDW